MDNLTLFRRYNIKVRTIKTVQNIAMNSSLLKWAQTITTKLKLTKCMTTEIHPIIKIMEM